MPSDLPDRISLLQAALWLVKGRKPVSEEHFQLAKVNLTDAETLPDGPLGELVVALHENRLQAYAGLGARTDANRPVERLPQRRSEDIPVRRRDWMFERVVWNESALLFAPRLLQVPPEFDPLAHPQMSYVLRTVGPAAYWFPIMLHTDDLAATFPRLHERPEEEQSAPKRGRPREINWDQFYVDLIVHADLDGLPSSQAECEQWAANWFMERLNKSPAVSTIREKIAPIYNHRRRTGKKAGK